MSELDSRIDEIVRALVRDVAAGVHSLYRGDIRQQTTQLKLSAFAKEAADKLRASIAGTGTASGSFPVIPAPGTSPGGSARLQPSLSEEEVTALTRCVMAWLPLGGAPNAATPDMKCTAGAREMAPTWGEREAARLAVRRIAAAG
ncbi:MAG: hypothetical protein H0X64_01765 [Gemmatimonadaceae bacterium]|nr:hypothetical protein [Gemmatimonadaceae bacterium]